VVIGKQNPYGRHLSLLLFPLSGIERNLFLRRPDMSLRSATPRNRYD